MSVPQPQNSTHPESVKDDVVLQYYKLGTLKAAAEAVGVNYQTVKAWVKHDWWQDKLNKVKTEADKQFDRKLSKIIDLASDAIEDRIQNGDVRVLKDGTEVRVPANLIQLGTILGISFDKRAAIRKTPVTDQSPTDILAQLAQRLEKLVDSKAPPVIEAEDVKFQDVQGALKDLVSVPSGSEVEEE